MTAVNIYFWVFHVHEQFDVSDVFVYKLLSLGHKVYPGYQESC